MTSDIFCIILIFAALCLVAWTLFTRRLKNMNWLTAIICGFLVFLLVAGFIKFSFFQFDQAIESMLSGF